jgi:hypothetical protein
MDCDYCKKLWAGSSTGFKTVASAVGVPAVFCKGQVSLEPFLPVFKKERFAEVRSGGAGRPLCYSFFRLGAPLLV